MQSQKPGLDYLIKGKQGACLHKLAPVDFRGTADELQTKDRRVIWQRLPGFCPGCPDLIFSSEFFLLHCSDVRVSDSASNNGRLLYGKAGVLC